MMMKNLRAATIGLLLAGAAPLFAQSVATPAAPASAAPVAGPDKPGMGMGMRRGPDGRGPMRGGHGGGMFAGLSDAGRATMREAMQAGGDPRAEREAVKAARDRMLVALDADRLDTSALKRAMDDERKAVQVGHDQRQAAMLAGFSKLSVADRKAFVANARWMKQSMENRLGRMQGGRDGRPGPGGPGGQRGVGGDTPPPPPM